MYETEEQRLTEQTDLVVALWTYIQEVMSSNVCRDTGYPD
jgi:aerobic-type carbon monoxide dehydrogenase small subunit (CoxS/CutS family)